MRRRRSYKELELENKLLQDTLASIKKDIEDYKKDLAHYKERVRVLEAYVSHTTKEIRNLTQDFQIIRNYVSELNEKLEEKDRKIAVLTTRLKYYENAHSPPSLQSLQYKKRKQGDNKQQTEASTKSAKKAGAQKGHKGVSRSHNPGRVVHHTFEYTPICECGNMMTKIGWKQRHITELIPAKIEETLHVIEMAACKCGKKQLAPAAGVPKSGSFGVQLCGAITALRAEKIPIKRIPVISKDLFGLNISVGAVNNIIARAADACESFMETIHENIIKSPSIHVDETGISLAGRRGWVWGMRAEEWMMSIYDKSRSSNVVNKYLNGYQGAIVTDRYVVYRRFDDGGKHQLCWAHLLRDTQALHAGFYIDPGAQDARIKLDNDLKGLFRSARESLNHCGPSAQLRHSFETGAESILHQYCDVDDTELQKKVKGLNKAIPGMFVFLEYDSVEPTNNPAEQALRYAVVFRKISGQIKGGERAMRRMSTFVSCVQTWRAQGLSVMNEVAARMQL